MYSLNDLQNLSQVTSTNQRFATDSQRAASSKDISLHGVSLSFGSLTILQNAQIKLSYGTKYALIGRNGIGKTTLLRCMANNLIPQWTAIRTYLVQQEFEEVSDTPIEMVKQSDPDHQALLREIEKAETDEEKNRTTAAELVALYEQLSIFDESEMERRTVDILSSLRFSKEMMAKPFKELSGGWRMKTLLACAVFARPHLLLLDEPTNHLDLESIQWLVGYLKGLECTVIVVSHDQDFLDQLAECIIHLTQKQLRYYPGNYSAFKAHRQDKLNEQVNTEVRKRQARESGATRRLKELEAPKIARMSKKNLVDTAWVWGGESLLVGDEGEDAKQIVLRFPEPDYSVSDPLVQLKSIGFSYGQRLLWDNVDLSIDRGSRIAILGRNGLGKSTLLRCIAGLEKPQQGQIIRHHNLRTAVFTQHLVQEIDLSKTAVQLLIDMFPELKTQTARDYLGSFGISGDRALTELRVLSGGQRTRFVFAMLMFEHPHLLLLDEPTSHLDMEMTEALIAALRDFKGAFVVISHHSYFLRKLDCQFYILKNKKLRAAKSLDDYLSSMNLKET
jgi:ATPase subunit of ABC transporter with duplicated ATPase domains